MNGKYLWLFLTHNVHIAVSCESPHCYGKSDAMESHITDHRPPGSVDLPETTHYFSATFNVIYYSLFAKLFIVYSNLFAERSVYNLLYNISSKAVFNLEKSQYNAVVSARTALQ